MTGRSALFRIASPEQSRTVIAGFLLVALVAEGIRLVSGTVTIHTAPAQLQAAHVRAPGTRAPDVNAIVAANLFGANTANVVPVESNLSGLVLAGTMAMVSPEEGMAIMAAADGTQRLLLAGDSIGGQATLKSVYQEYIVVERAGVLETIHVAQTSRAQLMASMGLPPPAAAPAQVWPEKPKQVALTELPDRGNTFVLTSGFATE
jgi:type II secretory pathway component PulC